MRVKNAGIEVSDQELALREATTKLTLARTEMHAFDARAGHADHRRRHEDPDVGGRRGTEGRRRAHVQAARPRDLARRHPAARRRPRAEGQADRSPLAFVTRSWTTVCRASNRPLASSRRRSPASSNGSRRPSARSPRRRDPANPLRRPRLPHLPCLPPCSDRDDLVTLLSFIGRTFVALGGAFLLRALTDAAIVPLPQGTALGLAYALAWLVLSDRATAADRPHERGFPRPGRGRRRVPADLGVGHTLPAADA